jgi:hypothetical protein
LPSLGFFVELLFPGLFGAKAVTGEQEDLPAALIVTGLVARKFPQPAD